MLGVVIDTVIFVRSLINPKSFCGKIVFFHNKSYQLFISEPIVREIIEVLQRPELTRKFKTLKNMDFLRVLEILGQANVVQVFTIGQVSRDPKDNKFLATAIAAKARYLVTEDKDLLDLKEYQGIKIIDTNIFLLTLEKGK
ncbi:putative toxin-antitoxin system toxin component, PIN family [Candidatus Gottesmanbacteria bacterium RIFCSPLOWO2_02_FULL_38_8]|uniref:Putative toxin-antitoxin system toxin component, PIN family n=1 Tax=Candidatus Gottesmanbacteria bacterium RIFCSPLOWO2_02_FULL_38_8 TaxID=1798397 RepID=A0A1F6B4C6_9BACT|nr:MAG: putative toxin-antitoxin system toxin component, PIN family [Candidatus Gottesmanbacteria bacterium RIFCSPLOWO2_02_FULL_38_8]